MIVPSGTKARFSPFDLQHNGNANPGEQPRSVNDVAHIVRTPGARAWAVRTCRSSSMRTSSEQYAYRFATHPVSRTDPFVAVTGGSCATPPRTR